jgi:hypothetical protein
MLTYSTIITAVIGAIAAIIAAYLSHRNTGHITEMKVTMDGRLEELIQALKAKGIADVAVAHLEGEKQGRADEKADREPVA